MKVVTYSFNVTGKGFNSVQSWLEIEGKKDAAELARLLVLADAENVAVGRTENEVQS